MKITNKTVNKTLKEATDKKLVSLVKNHNDSPAFEEICARYQNIFYRICHKYTQILINVGINPQDIYDEKNFIFYNCIKTFNPSKKTKLSSYLGNYARYLCLNSINAKKFIVHNPDQETIKNYLDISSTQQFFNNNSHPEEINYIDNLLEQVKD